MFTRRTREAPPDKSLLIRPVDEVARGRCRFVCFCCGIAFVIHVHDLENGIKHRSAFIKYFTLDFMRERICDNGIIFRFEKHFENAIGVA